MKTICFCQTLLLVFLQFSSFAFESITLPQGPVVMVISTRPDAIKMAPLYLELKRRGIDVRLCSTGQHGHLLDEVLRVFSLTPDAMFQIMKPGQDLFYITEAVLDRFGTLCKEIHPSLVLVHGDTSSAFAAALAAFYCKIPIGHVEAGLRSGNILAPFPEEMNRQCISRLASYHFAPTLEAVETLKKEGIDSARIFCTGNIGVDALFFTQERLRSRSLLPSEQVAHIVETCRIENSRLLILTAHRRESLGAPLNEIFTAIEEALNQHPDLTVVYPIHPSPQIRILLNAHPLHLNPRLVLTDALPYQDMVYLLDHADLVATDSGGLQEEAMTLGKKVIILRNETDRPEGLRAGSAILTGTDPKKITDAINELLNVSATVSSSLLPFGKGDASYQIGNAIQSLFKTPDFQ